MKGYKSVRAVYHAIVPEPLRDRLHQWSPRQVRALKRQAVAAFEKDAGHDDIYDSDYFTKFVDPTMCMSSQIIVRSIVQAFDVTKVVDVGCGTGILLEELKRANVDGLGLELADAGIAKCIERGVSVRKHDIERDPPPPVRADVVISTEVAEHLPADCADRFVALLAGIADIVVLTAATPGQGGTDHVNEQPNEYWIDKFRAHGRWFDEALSMQWRSRWEAEGAANCFWSSVMVFRSGAKPA